MHHTYSIGALLGLLELAVPFYGLRLTRRFGTKQIGWSLVGAFSCLAVVRLFSTNLGMTSTGGDLTRFLFYALVPVMLLIGMAHIEVVCREKARADAVLRARESVESEREVAPEATGFELMSQVAVAAAQHFNRHVTVIGLYAWLLRQKRFDPLTTEYHKRIAEEAERAALLGRQLLSTACSRTLRRQPVSLTRLTFEAVSELRQILGPGIVLENNCGQLLPPVLADPEHFRLILEALVRNAQEASPPGGTIRVSAEIFHRSGESERQKAEGGRPKDGVLKAGRFVWLIVADSGQGMDEGVRAHLFEPFFTTKDRSRHAGLGLASVYGLVKEHGGWVEVQSRPGRGTRVQVFLPVAC